MRHFTKLKTLVTFVLLAFSFAASAAGDVKISMQGVLKNFDGTAVSDNNYTVIFKLYTSPTGGTSFWSEQQTITTSGGVYNTMLGSTPAGLAALQGLAFNVPYYLGVTIVGSPEMSPRMELTGAPFAIRAAYAEGVVLPGEPTITSDSLTGNLELAGGDPDTNGVYGDVVIVSGQGRLIADSIVNQALVSGLITVNSLEVNIANVDSLTANYINTGEITTGALSTTGSLSAPEIIADTVRTDIVVKNNTTYPLYPNMARTGEIYHTGLPIYRTVIELYNIPANGNDAVVFSQDLCSNPTNCILLRDIVSAEIQHVDKNGLNPSTGGDFILGNSNASQADYRHSWVSVRYTIKQHCCGGGLMIDGLTIENVDQLFSCDKITILLEFTAEQY